MLWPSLRQTNIRRPVLAMMRSLCQVLLRRRGIMLALISCACIAKVAIISSIKMTDNEVKLEAIMHKVPMDSKPSLDFNLKDKEQERTNGHAEKILSPKVDKRENKRNITIPEHEALKKKKGDKNIEDSPLLKSIPDSSFQKIDVRASCFAPHPNVTFDSTSLSKPILNVGFSNPGNRKLLKDFFHCGGLNSTDLVCKNTRKDKKPMKHMRYCGACIRDAISDGLPPLESCGNFDVITQLNVEKPPDMCYWPQVEALKEIHEENPNATFILMFSDIGTWIESMKKWNGIILRLASCNITGFPNGVGVSDDELKSFYCQHVNRIREFVSSNPSHNLVEIDADQHSVGQFMSDAFQISSSCWRTNS
mmetsp:Transcript_18223/g.26715  ORF Transcript_18223/g.26715 Transcript_18223/m.26715 type:complete len:364 (+) Transcript_18223:2-1093(+)